MDQIKIFFFNDLGFGWIVDDDFLREINSENLERKPLSKVELNKIQCWKDGLDYEY